MCMSEGPGNEPTHPAHAISDQEVRTMLTDLDLIYKAATEPGMIDRIETIADRLQAALVEIPGENPSEKQMANSGKALQFLGQTLMQLHKCAHKFGRGSEGSKEFEMYARVNRAYKTWLAAYDRIKQVVAQTSVTDIRARIFQHSIVGPLVITHMGLKRIAE